MSTRYISPIAGLLLLRRIQRLLGFYLYVRTVLTASRVDVDLTYGRLTSELISLSVGSELTFYAVLDSFSARGHGKNCPVKIFEVYVEILGVLYFG